MAKLEWHQAVEIMKKNLVRIESEGSVGSGVRFKVPSKVSGEYNHCILTANHVINDSYDKKSEIKFSHENSRSTTWSIPIWRIVRNQPHDHALVLFNCKDEMPTLVDYDVLSADSHFKAGVEIGWLGYPSICGRSDVACFSHGHISAYLESEEAYLVDGVSIHGMSGGPAFVCENNGSVVLAGVVTNYFANKRPTGEVLPGMAMFRTIRQIQKYYEAK